MNEFVDFRMSPETHTVTRVNREVPYEFKDYKIDLDYEVNRIKDLQENFHPISNQEKRNFDNLNKHILTKRWATRVTPENDSRRGSPKRGPKNAKTLSDSEISSL